MDDKFLKGKVALITGGGSGLGAAICQSLASYGATIIVADINEKAATGVATAMHESWGNAVSWAHLDITDPDNAEVLIKFIKEKYQKLDILVNNAGIDLTLPVEELPVDGWKKVIDVNLTGAFIMSQLAFGLMADNPEGGNIINICSTASKMIWPNASAYHASKWGLLGLSHALYVEGKEKNINVSAIIAGGMRTPFILERFPDTDPNKLQDPKHVAETIAYILSLPKEVVIPEMMVMPQKESSWY
jgi:NAD(P)-dependent dehydrogenase (short-subunit alcohol dehydrogenase family)